MIPVNIRESRKSRGIKMMKNIERLYKDSKCRECSVVVTRMDFAKILGKFTKVKIQYESSSPKAKPSVKTPGSSKVNTRLRSNENGMVMINRKAYNPHPVKTPKAKSDTKKANTIEASTPRQNNILKENNRIKKNASLKGSKLDIRVEYSTLKRYGLVFLNPPNNNNISDNKVSLIEILPKIDSNVLPSEEWCIDFFPKSDEPKDDKVYDRIAAELEDLMFNKIETPEVKTETKDKIDDFPSIMDILNDTAVTDNKPGEEKSSEIKSETESNDVEAMLLGVNKETEKDVKSIKMEVETTPNINNLIEDVDQLNNIAVEIKTSDESKPMEMNEPGSPSIIDEAIKMGIEEHLPSGGTQVDCPGGNNTENNDEKTSIASSNEDPKESAHLENKFCIPKTVTHVVFKKNVNDNCVKSVTCLKSLRYKIELNGKSVDFLGAPKFIASLDDLIVLLQIVNETNPEFLYVRH